MPRGVEIAPVAVDRFARLMPEQLLSGDVAARKACLSSAVDAIIVSGDKTRIIGSNDNIRHTLGPKGQPKPWFVNHCAQRLFIAMSALADRTDMPRRQTTVAN